MTFLSVYWGFLFTVLIIPITLCEKADDEKRASLAYFKRSEENDFGRESESKRATLAYYKRSNPLVRRASLSYFKRAYNLCECPSPYLFEQPSFDKTSESPDWVSQHPYVDEEKRASLAYFKKRRSAD